MGAKFTEIFRQALSVENLLRQREELLGKLKKIAETCEGLENEENARRVTELNARQAELLAKKSEFKSNLEAVDSELRHQVF